MQYEGIKAIPAKTELLSMVKFEILNNIEYYGSFFNFKDTDFLEELDAYINFNQYSTTTIDLLVSALSNVLRCRMLLLKIRENEYFVECSDHIISPQREMVLPKFTIKLFWNGEHYDALIPENISTGETYAI